MVVYSSAVRPDNPEIVEARRRKLPVIPRGELLAELMRQKFGIAIAGSHGKTTTTSMVAAILIHANLDPTILVGGRMGMNGVERAPGQERLPGGRKRRERRIVPEAGADHRRGHQHRPRASGSLRRHRRHPRGVRHFHREGSVLRRGDPVPGRRKHPADFAVLEPPRGHLRRQRAGRVAHHQRVRRTPGQRIPFASGRSRSGLLPPASPRRAQHAERDRGGGGRARTRRSRWR